MSRDATTALEALDRRARSAATALLSRVDALVDVDGSPGSQGGTPSVGPDAARGTADRTPLVVRLDGRPAADRPSTSRRRRRTWLVAAAVVVVLAGAAAVVLAERDRDPSVTSGAQQPFLLPGWLPEGLEPTQAMRLEDVPQAGALGGDVAVYGDGAADDPWAGPTLAVFHITPDPSSFGDEVDGDAITVAGHPASLTHDEEGWSVEWPVDGGRVMVGGTGLGRDEVVAAAEAASADPAIDPAGLPEGFVELAQGPLDAAVGAGLGYAGTSSGVALSYTDGEDLGSSIAVAERPGTADAVDLARLALPDSEATTVRGHHAALARDEADARSVVVQWLEPPDLLVSVMASNLPDEAVMRFAEELDAASDGEVDALIRDHPFRSPEATFSELEDGQTLVADGENDEVPWRLVATDRPGESALDLYYPDGGSGFGWRGGAPTDDALAIGTAGIDEGAAAVFGAVDGSAASVTVEAPGRPAVTAELHAVEGWTYRAFVAFVPADLSDQAEVVARRADGSEVGREPVGTLAGSEVPDNGGGGYAEQCVTRADGSTECGSSEAGGATEATIPAGG